MTFTPAVDYAADPAALEAPELAAGSLVFSSSEVSVSER